MENTFNTELKRIRKAKGLTQEQLADMVGVSPQAVSKWEISNYPDAQLLPSVADALGVTIDELFGKGKEEKTIREQVLEQVKNLDTDKNKFDFFAELCNAFIMGCRGVSEYISPKEFIKNVKNESYSEITTPVGFSLSRLPENLNYFLFMPEPENGYDSVLAYDEKTAGFFRLLGEPDVLRVMYFFMEQKYGDYFNEKAVAQAVGISEEQAHKIIDDISKFGLISCINYNNGSETEKICRFLGSIYFIAMLTFTRTLLNRPQNFCFMSSSRNDRPYFKNQTYKKQ